MANSIDIGATWVYGTGNATTLGYEMYPAYYQGNASENAMAKFYGSTSSQPEITYYESRNNFRMPSYHRLDVGINFHKEK